MVEDAPKPKDAPIELSFGISSILKKDKPSKEERVTEDSSVDFKNNGMTPPLFPFQQPRLFMSSQEAICTKPMEYRRVGHPYQNRTPPKRKKPRTTFNRDQIGELEKRFVDQKYLASSERISLARQLKLTDSQVKTWFQNRRTKWRRQTSEEREAERNATAKLMKNFQPPSIWQPFIPIPLSRRLLEACRPTIPLPLP